MGADGIKLGHAAHGASAAPLGIAKLSKMMFDGEDLTPLWRDLVGKYIYRHDDAADP